MIFAESDDTVYLVMDWTLEVVFAVWAGVFLLFLYSLMKALQKCSPENRTMHPWLVGLNAFPFWNLFWPFWTVIQVSRSLRQEYRARRIPSGDQTFGRTVGLAAYFTAVLGLGLDYAAERTQFLEIPFHILLVISFPTQFVLMVVYWVKVVRLARPLKAAG